MKGIKMMLAGIFLMLGVIAITVSPKDLILSRDLFPLVFALFGTLFFFVGLKEK